MPAMIRLLAIDEVAASLGVPRESLRRMADKHGKTIVIGRAVRLHPDDIEELVSLCRVPPKVPVSTSSNETDAPRFGSSKTRVTSGSRQALATAAKLKRPSQNTSPAETGQVVRLPPRK
jgi:hypothetical protein